MKKPKINNQRLNDSILKLKLFFYNIYITSTSEKILYSGIIFFIISIIVIIYLNPSLLIFNDNSELATNLIALIIGLSAFIIGIANLHYTKELTIYGINYEKRKNGLIRLYNILQYNLFFFKEPIKLKYVKFILEPNSKKNELESFLKKLKEYPKIRKTSLIEEGEKAFLEDLIEFKRNYELYYLPKELIYEMKNIIDNKTELNEEDVRKITELPRKYLKKEFGIEL